MLHIALRGKLLGSPSILDHSLPTLKQKMFVVPLLSCHCRDVASGIVVDDVDVCSGFEEGRSFGASGGDWR